MTLRPYQQDALNAVATALVAQPVVNRALVKKPTGTGKTVTFAALPTRMRAWLDQFPPRERRMLVIAHREELLNQAAEKIKKANPDLLVCIEQGDRRTSIHADVVVASIQTLAARQFFRLKRLLAHGMTFRIVVVDEAHHAAASSYRIALSLLGFLPPVASDVEGNLEAPTFADIEAMQRELADWDRISPKDRLLLGVTATPNRTDAIGLGCVFQSLVYNYELRKAIEDGWLVPITALAIETDTSLDDVRTARGDFQQNQLAEAVNTTVRNKMAVAAWQEHAAGRSTIAFTVDVAHAHALAEEFQGAGVQAVAVSGETPREERRAALAAFSRGDVRVLTNCMVLTEGTDLPIASCILHAKPTKSATLYEQMTGRGLRLFAGKADCLVIDMVDVARKHSLMSSPVLFGLPPGLVVEDEADLFGVDDEFGKLREEFQSVDLNALLAGERLTLAELRAKAVEVNVWNVRDLDPAFTAGGRSIKWLRTHDDTYTVSYPYQHAHGDVFETMAVAQNLVGRWDITLRSRLIGGSGHAAEQVIFLGLQTAGEAAQVAEGWLSHHRPQAARMKAQKAPWMRKPATDKQLAMLRRMKVPFQPPLTSGRASELIDLAKARRPR